MTQQEFEQSLSVLQQGQFEVRPEPKDLNPGENTFEYIQHDSTGVTIQNINTGGRYLIPLSLIKQITSGVMWLTHPLPYLTDYFRGIK
jgi:hypothetical protein